MKDLLWRLADVTVPGLRRPRLDRVTLDIPSGVTAILGPSGAGKTTLLNLLVEFEKPATGTFRRIRPEVLAPGEPPGALPRGTSNAPRYSRGAKTEGSEIGSRLPVFWAPPGHGLWPHLTVKQHLSSILPESDAQRSTAANQMLQQWDLHPLADVYPGTLSQGERDRLAVARAIAADPWVLVLDEPLAHVPEEAANRYWSRLRTACEERKMSVVFATHDLSVAMREAAHVIALDAGQVVYAGSVKKYRRAVE